MRRSQPCRNSVPLHQTDLWIVAGAVPVSRAVALKETKFPRVWHRVCVCVSHVLLFCTHTHTQRNAVKRWKAACEGEHVTCVAWRACVLFCGGAGERPTRSCLRGNREGAGPAFGGRRPSREPYRRSSSLCLGEGQEVSEAGGRAGEPGIAQSGVECVTPLRLRCDIQILSIAP